MLEAVHALLTSRSFRTNKTNYLIQQEKPSFTIHGRLLEETGIEREIGMQRSRKGETLIRVDKKAVKSLADLVSLSPLIALEPSSFDFFDASPNVRRSFVNWLVFHVKPEFQSCWKQYGHALKQRNMLLRRGNIQDDQLAFWSEQLVLFAIQLEDLRALSLKELDKKISTELTEESSELVETDFPCCRLVYRNGWGSMLKEYDSLKSIEEKKRLMLEVLRQNLERDVSQGFGSYGSHRGDLHFYVEGQPVSEILSRGQKKRLLCLLYQNAADLIHEKSKKRSIFVLDDLPSEMDERHLGALLNRLRVSQAQLFVSAIEKNALTRYESIKNNSSLFHVKLGEIEQER